MPLPARSTLRSRRRAERGSLREGVVRFGVAIGSFFFAAFLCSFAARSTVFL